MPRVALGLEYDGSAYRGWQRQAHAPSVQACVEQALAAVACEPIEVHAAGRTDSGVHACGQVIHFDTLAQRPDEAWLRGVNTHLPGDIGVRWVRYPNADFDARRSAYARRYRYVVRDDVLPPVLWRARVGWTWKPLDAARMHRAAQCLIGEHDFSSFRAASCQAKHPWRRLREITVERRGRCVVVDVEANAFLHHMVRNIVGTLMQVGCGERSHDWVAAVLAARDRREAGATAVAQGLYFLGVCYPPARQMPEPDVGPVFA
jgi:tRNA pseudouridine38-40 synthase